jgi:hypothetical protein
MGPGAEKKIPDRKVSIRDVPFLSVESTRPMVVRANTACAVQVGLLTLESSYRLCLPVCFKQWLITAFVLDYSGGPAPEFHGVP